MPETQADLLTLLREIKSKAAPTGLKALIEKVASSPVQSPKSAFTFGGSYWGLKMALLALEIPFTEVAPNKWQTALSCQTKGDKNVSKIKAQQLFPYLKITHSTADALLIAEYLRLEELENGKR